jgi:transcriptional regulator GlxA family with amidase domain
MTPARDADAAHRRIKATDTTATACSSRLRAAAHRLCHPRNTTSANLPERLSEVLALIARAPHTKLTNHFLAERAGMSVERFIRSFFASTPARHPPPMS